MSKDMLSVAKDLCAAFGRGEGLKQAALRGGTLLGIASVSEQTFRIARSLLLTRLLAPEAFGIMAIVYATSYVVDMLADIGVGDAIVQNPKGNERSYVNSAWWLSFCRGVVIYAILFVASPWVGRFYGHIEIEPLMRLALLSIVFAGARSPGAYVALKEMRFKQWAIIQNGAGVAGSVVVVILACFIQSVWALAFGYVAEHFIRCIVSYVVCPFLPTLEFDNNALRHLLRFSRGVFGLSFLYLIFSRTDIFVLGKLFSATELGVYTMAVYLVQVPMSFIVGVIRQTLMPSIARIQDDRVRINRILYRATSAVVLFGMPGLIFLVLSSRSLLSLVYGDRYGSGSLALTIAALVAFVNVTNNLITVVFFATGNPGFHRRCVIIMAVLMLGLIYPSVKLFGLAGGQIAALVAVTGGYISQIARIRHLMSLDLSKYIRSSSFVIGVSFVVLALALGIREFLTASGPIANLALGGSGCALALYICGRSLMRRPAADA